MPTELTPWTQRAKEILADGAWHSGAEVMREMRRLVPPGVAMRKVEKDRQLGSASRNGQPKGRIRQRSTDTLVSIGARRLCREALVKAHARGGVVIDPWPVPARGWSTGEWKIRAADTRYTLTWLARRWRTSTSTLHATLNAHPEIPRSVSGRRTELSSDAALDLERALADRRRHRYAVTIPSGDRRT